MTHLFTESVHCELHLTHTHYCVEDAVEGYAIIAAERPFLLDNAHIEIVGGERIGVTVDQVEESTTPEKIQYGVSHAEYVYFRVLYTLAGWPLTYSPNVSFAAPQPHQADENNNTSNNNNNNDVEEDKEGRASHHRGYYHYASHGQGVVGTSARTTLQNSFAEPTSSAAHSINTSFITHGATETNVNVATTAAATTGALPPHGETYMVNRSMAESRPLSLRNDSMHRSFLLHALQLPQQQHHSCSYYSSHGEDHTLDEQPGPAAAMMMEERGAVRFPAGRYVYPFHCPLPPGLPASYETGTCVKDGQYSVSKASLQYYVKLQLLGKHSRVLAHARADFILQPRLRVHEATSAVTGNVMPAMSETPSVGHEPHTATLPQCEREEEMVVQPHEAVEDDNNNRVAETTAVREGSNNNSSLVNSVPTAAQGRTVVCRFHAVVLGGLWTSGSKVLLARLTLPQRHYVIGRDRVALHCVFSNATGHTLSGLRLVLRQELTFHTPTAKVMTSREVCTTTLDTVSIPVTQKHTTQPYNNNKTETSVSSEMHTSTTAMKGTKAAGECDGFAVDIATDVIPRETHVLPTLHTAGLQVRYAVRLELLSSHIAHGHYEFDDVCLVEDLALPIHEAEPQQPEACETEACETEALGKHNSATTSEAAATTNSVVVPLAPGKLTRPEYGIYLVPRYPVVQAVLPSLEMLSHFPSPMPSRNPTRMHSRLPSPTAQ